MGSWQRSEEQTAQLAGLLHGVQQACQHSDMQAAQALLVRMAQVAPQHPWLAFAQGVVHKESGAYAEARQALRAALALDPHFWEAWMQLALTELRLHQYLAAVNALLRVLELQPGCLGALQKLLSALIGLGDHPSLQALLQDLLHPDWQQGPLFLAMSASDQQTSQSLQPMWAAQYLISRFSQPECTETEIWRHLRSWAQCYALPLPKLQPIHKPDPERLLRIGWVSNEGQTPMLQHGYWSLLPHHDRSRFVFIAYLDQLTLPAVLPPGLSAWYASQSWDAARFAEQIQLDQIDILVDLSGYFNALRLPSLSRKPAPVQISAGSNPPFGTGLAAFDARWTDPVLTPPDLPAAQLATGQAEPCLDLPTFFRWQPPAEAWPLLPPPCLSQGRFSFAVLASPNKLSPQILALWARLLQALHKRQLPSQLCFKGLIYRDVGLRERLRQHFRQLGCAAEQIHFDGNENAESHFGFLQNTDMVLDTSPYAGALSSCDAIWMGVPVLSLAGGRRIAESLHRALGTQELLLAQTPDDYLHKALDLCQQPERLKSLRLDLRSRLLASPLCQLAEHAAQMEKHYRQLWRKACQQQSPVLD